MVTSYVYTRTEVARLLGVDARTVSTAIEEGTIMAVRIGRRVLIPRHPFDEMFGIADPELSDSERQS